MPTQNKLISGYVPPRLFEKFSAWEKAEGFTSRSRALIHLIERFSDQGGFNGVSLADRVKTLEEKVEKLTAQQQNELELEDRAPKILMKLDQTRLAERLDRDPATLSNRRKNKKDIYEWSKKLDPEGLGWRYDAEGKCYVTTAINR